jgi:hypothetical protein
MGTLSLTTSHLTFKKVASDRLFYDHWQYCVKFYFQEVTALRKLDHASIDEILDRRIEWREKTQWGAARSFFREITVDLRLRLHLLCDYLLPLQDVKIVLSTNHAWIYTNDLNLLVDIGRYPDITNCYYTEAVVDRPKDTVLLKSSQFKQRSYFRCVKLTAQEKTNLKEFFTNNAEFIRTSKSLNEWWADWSNSTYLMDHYFIDHNESTHLTMLGLIRPGLIRKTKQIVTG